jgi:hypothetical protein
VILEPMRRLPHSGPLLLTIALLLVACTEVEPSATSSLGQPATASASADASPGVMPTAGQPYDAAALLTAMRDSTRPGGVPDELETDAVAAALADHLWTWDGRPWETISVGGACGPAECSLEVAGSAEGMAGADLYLFSVDPATGEVTAEPPDLHGYPTALDAVLDAMARAAAADEIGDLAYTSARWLPPPQEGRYWLAYRTGGEEGAPGLDLLLDAGTGAIVERREV